MFFNLFDNHFQACQQHLQHHRFRQTLSNSVKEGQRQLPLHYPISLQQDCQIIHQLITFQLSIKHWYTLLSLSIKHISFQPLQLHH